MPCCRTVLLLILILCNQYSGMNESKLKGDVTRIEREYLTEQEALDLVKKEFATNFIKVFREDESYFYRLDFADYYLVSEGPEGDRYYLIHLYEFVVDEEDTGIGHTVTYGWFAVDRRTGEIEERMVY